MSAWSKANEDPDSSILDRGRGAWAEAWVAGLQHAQASGGRATCLKHRRARGSRKCKSHEQHQNRERGATGKTSRGEQLWFPDGFWQGKMILWPKASLPPTPQCIAKSGKKECGAWT
mmetsp:Transcript_56401/g.123238  ORF Transcript_56401/g.123238 Transcript_56401/m.123238 type:complete len:117 (-) Transcript_56401:44-394(-)